MSGDVFAVAVSRLTAFASLSQRDVADLATLAGRFRSFDRGEHLCREGDPVEGYFLLLKGWAASSVAFADGGRALVKVHLPGDMMGLPALALRAASETIVALTPVEAGVVSRHAIGRLFEINPRVAAILFAVSQEERVAAMDRLASVSATDALNRVAALMLHLHARAARSDPTTTLSFSFPLSRSDVADLIGITPVHLTRTLVHLRQHGVIRWEKRILSILDRDALAELAGLPLRELDHDPDWLPKARPTE